MFPAHVEYEQVDHVEYKFPAHVEYEQGSGWRG